MTSTTFKKHVKWYYTSPKNRKPNSKTEFGTTRFNKDGTFTSWDQNGKLFGSGTYIGFKFNNDDRYILHTTGKIIKNGKMIKLYGMFNIKFPKEHKWTKYDGIDVSAGSSTGMVKQIPW